MQTIHRTLLSHTFVAALAVAAFYLLTGGSLTFWTGNDIVVTEQQRQQFIDSFKRTWQREPSAAELQALTDDWLREEMAYRAGVRGDTGHHDVVVRRRFRELLEADAAASVSASAATVEQLQSYLDAHSDEFRIDSKTTFRQIYFDVESNGIGADASARYVLGGLRNQEMPEDIEDYGDRSILPALLDDLTEAEISEVFGNRFAAALQGYPIGEWSGPVRSDRGLHLVYIDTRGGGSTARLEDVEDAVRQAWTAAQIAAAVESTYERLRGEYDVQSQ